jgi:hypothetical protein
MTDVRLEVATLNAELIDELARSISHRDCRLAELHVELSWAKKKYWRDEFFTVIADAVERNASLLHCVVETENYSSTSDTSHPDALRIERLCQMRADEHREVVRRKKASMASGSRSAVLAAAAVSIAAIATVVVVWAVFFRKKDE